MEFVTLNVTNNVGSIFVMFTLTFTNYFFLFLLHALFVFCIFTWKGLLLGGINSNNSNVEGNDPDFSYVYVQYDIITFLGDGNIDDTFDNTVNQTTKSYGFIQIKNEPTELLL